MRGIANQSISINNLSKPGFGICVKSSVNHSVNHSHCESDKSFDCNPRIDQDMYGTFQCTVPRHVEDNSRPEKASQ